MDNLTNRWKKAKESVELPSNHLEQLIAKAKDNKRSTLFFHYGNLITLSLLVMALSLFFYYVAPFQELLSRIGVLLMIGGILIRIVIEFFSTSKFKRIQLVNDASSTTQRSLEFYNFRKKIHGPVTLVIVALYTIGFWFLTPEFNKYIPFEWMIAMHLSYVLGAVFLVWQIRKGIQKEMKNLSELVELKRDMESTS